MSKTKKRVNKICPICNKEFQILQSRLKWGGTYCSQECQKNRAKKIIKKCSICKKEYAIWPYQTKTKAPTCSIRCTRIYLRNKYNKKIACPTCQTTFWTSKKNPLKHCSMECRNKSYLGKNMTGMQNTCPVCNKRFYVQRSRLDRKEGIFCSKQCKDISPNKSIEQRIKEGGLVELICSWCDKPFIRSRYFKDIQKYCSQECAKKSKSETKIESKVRNSLENLKIYFEQEKAIKKLKKGSYFVDFFIPPNIIIECDGSFWHNEQNFPKAVKKDILKREYLIGLGYKVYPLKEEEIMQNSNSIIEKIIKENSNIEINSNKYPIKKPKKRIIVTKVCKNCGNPFETIPSREKKHNFCNMKCKNEFYMVKSICKNCNNEFITKRYKVKKEFCRISCKKEFTKNKNKKYCLNCSKEFYPNPADTKRGKAKFCSRECIVLYRKPTLLEA